MKKEPTLEDYKLALKLKLLEESTFDDDWEDENQLSKTRVSKDGICGFKIDLHENKPFEIFYESCSEKTSYENGQYDKDIHNEDCGYNPDNGHPLDDDCAYYVESAREAISDYWPPNITWAGESKNK